MKLHFKNFKFLFLAVLLVATIDLSILRWYFPPTEGWWETYAWLMASGEKLYTDVWLALPPLQVLLLRLEMMLVGHDFMMLRLMGVVTHGLAVSLLYLWLRRLTTPSAAFLGAVLSTLLIIFPNGAYIVRDYHTTIELFEVLALGCSVPVFLRAQSETSLGFNKDFSATFGIIGIGIACGSLVLLKQNVGVFFTAFFALALILKALEGRRMNGLSRGMAEGTIFVLAFAAIPLAVTLYMGSDWFSVYYSNRSKGGVGLVLTRFLVDEDSRKVSVGSILAIILFVNISWIRRMLENFCHYVTLPDILVKIISDIRSRIAIFLAAAFLMRLGPSYIIFALSLCWLADRAVAGRSKSQDINITWYKFGWLPLIGLVYCGTHTAGYNFISMQLILALLIADLTCRYGDKLCGSKKELKIMLVGIFATLLFALLKLSGPLYDWWGLQQEGAIEARYSLPFDELKGFRVDKSTADFYGKIAEYKATMNVDESVFAYPSIPIVYLLLNKLPPVKSPVLWFDVSEEAQSSEILAQLESNMPATIFWLSPAEFVYSGHANLRRLPSLMSGIDSWLYKKISAKQYLVDDFVLFDVNKTWRSKVPDIRDVIETRVTVLQEGLSCRDILATEGVISVTCFDGRVSVGEKIGVSFVNQYWFEKNIKLIGIPFSSDQYYIFVVLKRQAIGQ